LGICAREKPSVDLEKDLKTCGEGRKSRKRPTLVVGKKPNGKPQVNASSGVFVTVPGMELD
jgi:hypothetical protein